MASWDTPAVAAPSAANYAAPLVDFSKINPVDDYFKGRQEVREEDKANLFRNGIPRQGGGDTGPYDLDKIATDTAKVGGPEYAKPFMDLQITTQQAEKSRQAAQEADRIANGGQPAPQGQPAPYGTPAPSPRVVTPVAGAQPGATRQSGDAPGSIMSLIPDGVSADDTGRIASKVANEFKLDPNAPPDPKMVPRIRARIANLTGIPLNQPSVAPQPVAAPGAPPAAPPQPPVTPNDRVAQGFVAAEPNSPVGKLQVQADRYGAAEAHVTQAAIDAAAMGNKALADENRTKAGYYHDLQKGVMDQIAKANEPTGNMKEYDRAVAQGFKGTADDWAAQTEADKATAGERAKSDVKEQNEYIAAGKQAGSRLTTLNTIGNIVNSDKNLTLGFGADTALKIKMGLQQLGVPVGDLSGAEGIQKMNAALASEMAKSLSGRPTQFEFKSFMANNPGLLLDKSGNQRLIGIYSQLAQREYQLGKMARQNGDSWSNWDNVVEKYDAQHPIIDPISKQPISTNSVIAPGPSKGTAPAAPPVEGAMAINPKTGERLKLQDGKWVPFA